MTAGQDDELARIQTRRQLADFLERHRAESGQTFDDIVEKLATAPTTAVARSSVHDWLTATSLPNRSSQERFIACAEAIGVESPGRVLDAVARIRAAERRGRRNPYVGLRPYTEHDADLFIGRSQLVEAALTTIERLAEEDPTSPITVLGPSGSGKSSILQAGIGPRLAAAPDGIDYVELGLGPATQIADALGREPRTKSGPHRVTRRRYLILDQFERLLLDPDHHAIERTIAAMTSATGPDLVLVLGLRSDFYDQASLDPFLASGLGQRSIHIGPLTVDQAADAAVEAAEVANRRLETDLVSELRADFQDVAAGRGPANVLPLLSHVLRETADATDEMTLTLEDYRSVGGLAGALEDVAEGTFLGLAEPARETCGDLFLQLVSLGEDGQVVGRTRRVADLVSLFGGMATVVSDAFVDSRLLTANGEGVHLSHESLARSWSRLGQWIDDAQAVLVAERQIRTRARLWIDSGETPTHY